MKNIVHPIVALALSLGAALPVGAAEAWRPIDLGAQDGWFVDTASQTKDKGEVQIRAIVVHTVPTWDANTHHWFQSQTLNYVLRCKSSEFGYGATVFNSLDLAPVDKTDTAPVMGPAQPGSVNFEILDAVCDKKFKFPESEGYVDIDAAQRRYLEMRRVQMATETMGLAPASPTAPPSR